MLFNCLGAGVVKGREKKQQTQETREVFSKYPGNGDPLLMKKKDDAGVGKGKKKGGKGKKPPTSDLCLAMGGEKNS